MFERFSSAARKVVIDAQTEARDLGHPHIGTEHLLLALLAQESGAGAPFGVEREAVKAKLVELLDGKELGAPPEGHIPFTPRAKKVLELGLREALQLGHNEIGATHIGLGLLREGDGLAMKVLPELGSDIGAVKARLLKAAVDEVGPSRRGRGGGRRFRFGRPSGIGDPREALLSSLRDPESPAARVIREKGLDPAELADEIAAADETVEDRLAAAIRIEIDDAGVAVRVTDPDVARRVAAGDQSQLARRLAAVFADVDPPAG